MTDRAIVRLVVTLGVLVGCPPPGKSAVTIKVSKTPTVQPPKAEWEHIGSYVRRTRVPGGWLVKSYSDALLLVPDPQHAWLAPEAVQDGAGR